MRKYTVDVYGPGHAGYLSFEWESDDNTLTEDQVVDRVRELLAIEATRATVTYDVTLNARFSFEYEDTDGDYETEDDVKLAFEQGDLDPSDYVSTFADADETDFEVDEQL